MRIDGKEIAAEIFENLKKNVLQLKQKNIIPQLAIILVGNDPASQTYVRQKELKLQAIGGKATIFHYESSISTQELLKKITALNTDSTHGVIVQRPLPQHIDEIVIDKAVLPQKDIDAFRGDSPYPMPLAAAVIHILSYVHKQTFSKKLFSAWLQTKKIVVIGKGKTGGEPTITELKKLGAAPSIIDSKTKDPKNLTAHADIIISAVGKSNVVTSDKIKKGVILISIGLHKESDGKLHGDYEEEDIKDMASFYTPTPGGVGPVNVAMLLKNLMKATIK